MGSDRGSQVVTNHQKKVPKKSTFWYFLTEKSTKTWKPSFGETGSGNQKTLVPLDRVCFHLPINQIS